MKYLFLTSLIIFSSSCSNENIFKPVEIKYGQDICEACSMIISEKEYSAQYLLQDDKVKKFDDIGCMIHYLNDNKLESDIAAFFVRDYIHKNWINVGTAHFMHSDKIITPMGHGIVAFSNEQDLKNIKLKIEGKYLGGFEETIAWFLEKK
jgi:copper chaperone NosL